MRVIVTCGPAYAPIDEVRRITNFSTGALGVQLANACAAAGHSVLCLKGEIASTSVPLLRNVDQATFTTNDDLSDRLGKAGEIDAIFHAAALCDYEVEHVADSAGIAQTGAKIPSRAGALTLTLKPARKILPGLRVLFPSAWIVGWKYELDGSRDDAVAAAVRQLRESATDLCVVNGAAYGGGFGIVDTVGEVQHIADRAALFPALISGLSENTGRPAL